MNRGCHESLEAKETSFDYMLDHISRLAQIATIETWILPCLACQRLSFALRTKKIMLIINKSGNDILIPTV